MVLDLRQHAGLTQALLAQLSGVSQKSISRYEVGSRSPTLDVLARLATAVDLAIEIRMLPNPEDRAPEAVGLRAIVSFAPAETGDVTKPPAIDRAPRPKYPYL